MKLVAIQIDITKLTVDAIVNAANSAMIIGGGVDGAIHAAAGQELINYNAQHHGFGCATGQVKITPGYNLPAKHIFHTVGPDMREYPQELGDLLLSACYGNCMTAAKANDLKSIAFPAISTGVYGFDKKRAAKIAVDVIFDHFADTDIEVFIACFNEEDQTIIRDAIDYRDERDYYLTWSVGDTHFPDGPNGEYLPDAEQVLDLDTEVPDGVYKVFHDYRKCNGEKGIADGVTIKDGKFVPEPTLRACAEARNKAGYGGTFLEGLVWRHRDSIFEAQFGS